MFDHVPCQVFISNLNPCRGILDRVVTVFITLLR